MVGAGRIACPSGAKRRATCRPQDWALGEEGEATAPESYFLYVEDAGADG